MVIMKLNHVTDLRPERRGERGSKTVETEAVLLTIISQQQISQLLFNSSDSVSSHSKPPLTCFDLEQMRHLGACPVISVLYPQLYLSRHTLSYQHPYSLCPSYFHKAFSGRTLSNVSDTKRDRVSAQTLMSFCLVLHSESDCWNQ